MVTKEKVEQDLIVRMKEQGGEGTRWAAYENHDLGHPEPGHRQYITVGPNNTLKEAPQRLPDMNGRVNWRYQLIGFVDLETGEVTAAAPRGVECP